MLNMTRIQYDNWIKIEVNREQSNVGSEVKSTSYNGGSDSHNITACPKKHI